MRKQLALFDDETMLGDAAEAIEKDGSRLRRLVFRAVQKSSGLTSCEIHELTHIEAASVRTRIWELRTRGLLRDSGEKRMTEAKRKAIVWVVPPAKVTKEGAST